MKQDTVNQQPEKLGGDLVLGIARAKNSWLRFYKESRAAVNRRGNNELGKNMNDFLNYLGLPPFELALFFGSVLIMTVVGIAKIHWVEVEGYLLRKGWVPWLNNREERENQKLDQYLKGYYERQKERENDC